MTKLTTRAIRYGLTVVRTNVIIEKLHLLSLDGICKNYQLMALF